MELPLHKRHLTDEENRTKTGKGVIILALILAVLLAHWFYSNHLCIDLSTVNVYVEVQESKQYSSFRGIGLKAHLAVAINRQLEFFAAKDNKLENIEVIPLAHPISPRALAYDPFNDRIFLSSTEKHETMPNVIYQINLTGNHEPKPLIKETEPGLTVMGIAYDNYTDTIFWTNGDGHYIQKRVLSDENSTNSVLFDLGSRRPTGIVLDDCSRTLFWGTKEGTLEKGSIDGGDIEVVLSNLKYATDLAIDQESKRLFWSDYVGSNEYQIETMFLNGSSRKVLVKGDGHIPISVGTTETTLYWAAVDGKHMYSIPLNSTWNEVNLENAHEFSDNPTMGIITLQNSKIVTECNNFTSAKNSGTTIRSDVTIAICLNGGTLIGKLCECIKGYTGPRCAVKDTTDQYTQQNSTPKSVGNDTQYACEQIRCCNYCINNGTCLMNEDGEPRCQCVGGYNGPRCQNRLCENFCLNDGECIIQDGENVTCNCLGGYVGSRCEISPVYSIHQNSSSLYMCPVFTYTNLFYGFISTIVIMGVIISVLLVILYRHSKRPRPRIKRRIIVGKGVTPLTNRPPPAGDECEITIENCCNMNICETPCYEPPLRSDKKLGSLKKTEEKKNLLEEDLSCAPCDDSLY